jgi:hypothetical protein
MSTNRRPGRRSRRAPFFAATASGAITAAEQSRLRNGTSPRLLSWRAPRCCVLMSLTGRHGSRIMGSSMATPTDKDADAGGRSRPRASAPASSASRRKGVLSERTIMLKRCSGMRRRSGETWVNREARAGQDAGADGEWNTDRVDGK